MTETAALVLVAQKENHAVVNANYSPRQVYKDHLVDENRCFSYADRPDFLGKDGKLLDLARPFGISETPQSQSNGRELQVVF
jgi:hypothetical protein